MTLIRKNTRTLIVAVFAAAAVSAGCGDVSRQGQAPVYLVLDSIEGRRGGASSGANSGSSFLSSDVITLVTSPAPCTPERPCPTIFSDSGVARFHLSMKDIGNDLVPTSPTTNNAVTLNRYRVSYRRADGRNTPGVDVPYAFEGAATITIPGSSSVSTGFELVRSVAKQESPLVQLNYNSNVISTIADVTFYGQDQVGNDITVTGSLSVDFSNFGDF
jgi:hypothetical protein